MKRRIFFSISIVCAMSLILLAVILSYIFYNRFSQTIINDLRGRAAPFASADITTALEELDFLQYDDVRVTLIDTSGTVIYDNEIDPTTLDNHLSRDEVQEALNSGISVAKRYSSTFDAVNYYYAVRLTDGAVLRLASSTDSVWSLLFSEMPAVVLAVLAITAICYFTASKLSRRIVAPLDLADPQSNSVPYDELSPYARTISEQRRHISQQSFDLEQQHSTLQTLMNSLGEGIIMVDVRKNIISANRRILDILEIENESEARGRNILEIIRSIPFSQHAQQAIEGKRSEMTLELVGQIYRVYFSSISGSGGMALFLDVTERLKAERMRREFTANVSHELKTPVTSIYGNAELLAGGMVREEDKPAFYQKIKDEAERLSILINDILLISKLDEKGSHHQTAEVELAKAAKECISSLSTKADAQGITLMLETEPLIIEANPSMIQELFGNLIDNAIKYNKPGGTVKISISKKSSMAKITVTDNGIGIPPAVQSRVFERFYRVDSSRSRQTGGTGLGLAIVKHIALTHGGKISLKSTPDIGTTVSVMLPLRQ